MKMKEIVALAVAGYKKKDIDELLALELPEDDQHEEPQDEVIDKKEEPEEEQKRKSEEDEKPEPAEDEIDYKKLYEESQLKIKELQQSNVKKDIEGDEESLDDILSNLAKDFM